MPTIYLSPSLQPYNQYSGGGDEQYYMNKVADAARKQIENIDYIERTVGLSKLPDKLQAVAQARKAHPEVSLKELGELVAGGPISKSGVNHRLRKINEFAQKLQVN